MPLPIDPRLKERVLGLSYEDRALWEERAAIIEYDGNMPRVTAEQEAWKQLFEERGK
jgi:hypothetical protein